MIRFSAVFPAFLLCLPALAWAGAADDNVDTLVTVCGRSDLPAADVDVCLDRVRAAEDTSDSPELLSLQARLEQRAAEQAAATDSGPQSEPDASGDDGDSDGGGTDDKDHTTRDPDAMGVVDVCFYDTAVQKAVERFGA